MNRHKLLWAGFTAMILIQWFIPGSMAFEREKLMFYGKVFRFRTQPIDPIDPFRGRYITLNFAASSFPANKEQFVEGDEIYVQLSTDSAGYATIKEVSRKPPEGGNYVKARVGYPSSANMISIEYPFSKFYMEEQKAPRAEIIYNRSLRDSSETYATVMVNDGKAAIQDIFVNGNSIRELSEKD